jgi:hypothetical protein
MDTPSANAALVIPPPGANQPTANGAIARVGDSSGTITDGFVLTDSVDNVYRRVGEALGAGDIGKVEAHDDAAHSYTLSVIASADAGEKRGFFSRMFGHGKSGADAPGAAPHQVQVSIAASGQNATELRAQGDAAAVAKVVDTLKARLGG